MENHLASTDAKAIHKALQLTDSRKTEFLPKDRVIEEYVRQTETDKQTAEKHMRLFIESYDVRACKCKMCSGGKINYVVFLQWASTNNNWR